MAAADNFLADAMEGFSAFPEGKHEERLAGLQHKLGQRTQRERSGFMRIAVAVAMLIIAGGVFWTVNNGENLTSENKSMAYEPAIEKEEMASIVGEEEADPEEVNDAAEIIQTKEVELLGNTTAERKKITTPTPAPIMAKKRKDKFESPKTKEVNTKVLVLDESAMELADDISQEAEKIGLNRNVEAEAVTGFTLAELDAELQMDTVATSQPAQKYIIGTVRSSNQEPLIGVNIQVAGTDVMTVSDFSGQFKLEWGIDINALEFSYVGFEKTTTAIAGPGNVEVMMDESERLSEVVVIAERKERTKASKSISFNGEAKEATSAVLVASYRKFERYVRRNKVHPKNANGEEIKGSVQLQFFVQADGQISEVAVLTSTNDALNVEAIRLLQNGPKWKNEAGMVQLRAYVLVFE